MKYVQGETLLQYIHSKDFTIKKAVRALVQVCHALEFAHSKNIYHRDVKPENIMLGDFGAIYLLDWGLAIDRSESKPLAQEGLVGTLGYMAPEMLKGSVAVVDERTDVYLLGSTLHEVLVQMPRHNGDRKDEIHDLIRMSKPVKYSDEIPAYLADLCNKSCAQKKEDRIQDVSTFRKSLQHFLEREQAYILCDQGIKEKGLLQV